MAMPWIIDTNPLGNLGLSALAASAPILFLFWALAVRRMKGHWAALGALGISVLVAVSVYGMPVRLSFLSVLFGALFGLWPISWIVIAAIFVYNLSSAAGDFEIIKNSLAAVSDDRRIQALLIAFSFGAFIEGAAGFGTPVAITAAMLAGLGFNPVYAAGICLLANTAPVAFGAIGIPIIIGSQVSGVDQMGLSQTVGRQLLLISAIIPFYMVVLMSGMKKGMEIWPAALVSGGSFALTQFLASNYLGPLLPSILASIASIVSLTAFLRIWHPAESWRFPGEPPGGGRARLLYSGREVFRAWTPFIVLSILVAFWGIRPVKELLDHYSQASIPICGLHGMIIREGTPLPAVFNVNFLSAAGTAVMLAGFLSIPVTGVPLRKAARVFAGTLNTLKWAVLTIAGILGFAYIMNYSGMAITLGIVFSRTGAVFPFFAAFLGWIGVFMTGSDASSNALFSRLQETTAAKIGIDPVITVAANSSGGVCGKMISPQSLSVATAAAGLVGREGEIFRFTFKHSLVLTFIIGLLAWLQSNLLAWTVPPRTEGAGTAVSAAAKAAGTGVTADGIFYLAIGLALTAAAVLTAKKKKSEE